MKFIGKAFLVAALGFSVTACGMFGSSDKKIPDSKVVALGVNGYLWRASLDVLSFMSIASADRSTGAILTEWRIDPNIQSERVKVNVLFQSQELRSDGIRVVVTRQTNTSGVWVDMPVKATTAIQVQNAILDQARILRQKDVAK